jgi:hypothetical protein
MSFLVQLFLLNDHRNHLLLLPVTDADSNVGNNTTNYAPPSAPGNNNICTDVAPQSVEEFNASTGVSWQHVGQQTQHSASRRRVAPGRGTYFSQHEMSSLMNLIDSTLPLNAQDWVNIASALYIVFPQSKRTDKGCQCKFPALCNRNPRSGDTMPPPEVAWAKQIRSKIAQ